VSVPLALAPPPPSRPTIAVSETRITVRWNPSTTRQPPEPAAGVLPSRPLGRASADVAHNVYDRTTGAGLTPKPITEREFEDSRVEWGATRCYAVRTVQVVGASPLESEDGEAACEKLVDTFPPAPPKGLRAVGTDGAINLIWE